jgi:hypothetical protein
VLEQLHTFEGGEGFPTVVLGNDGFGFRLLGHFEEEQVGELGDVVGILDAIVAEDVAEVPEFLDDVEGGGHEEKFASGKYSVFRKEARGERRMRWRRGGPEGAGLCRR